MTSTRNFIKVVVWFIKQLHVASDKRFRCCLDKLIPHSSVFQIVLFHRTIGQQCISDNRYSASHWRSINLVITGTSHKHKLITRYQNRSNLFYYSDWEFRIHINQLSTLSGPHTKHKNKYYSDTACLLRSSSRRSCLSTNILHYLPRPWFAV